MILRKSTKSHTIVLIILTMIFTILIAQQVWASAVSTVTISGSYSTIGGYPHYNIAVEGITTDSSTPISNIYSIDAKVVAYKNGVLAGSGSTINYSSNVVRKTLNLTDYDGGYWEAYNVGQSIYTDGSKSSSESYDDHYFVAP